MKVSYSRCTDLVFLFLVSFDCVFVMVWSREGDVRWMNCRAMVVTNILSMNPVSSSSILVESLN